MSQYPQQIDNNITLPISDSQTALSPSLLNKLRDAIYKIEVELGIFPSGETYADVRSRLDAMEGRLGNSISINGDIGGTYYSPVVIGINGIPLNISALQNNQVLTYDSFLNAWTNKFLSIDTLKPPFGFDMVTTEATLLEVGQTLLNPSFSVTYTDDVLYLAALSSDQDGYVQDVTSTPTSFSSDYSYTKNSFGETVTFTLSCSTADNPGVFRTDSILFTWGQKNYWGASEEPIIMDGYFIESLSGSELNIVKNKTFEVNAGADQYIYFSCRSAYGDVILSVNGFEGGFSKVATVSLNGENYDVYRSDNPNLGETVVIAS